MTPKPSINPIHSLPRPTSGEALAESQLQRLASMANNLRRTVVNRSKAFHQSQPMNTGTEAGKDGG